MQCSISEIRPAIGGIVLLADIVMGFVLRYGAPKEIRVSNVIVEAGLEQICKVCGIKLCRVKKLQELDSFIEEMYQFGL